MLPMNSNPYIFSFTALAFRLNDTIKFYEQWKSQNDDPVSIPEEMAEGKASTSTWKRQQREYVRRITALTPFQQPLLLSTDYDTARQIAFLGVCKSYDFILDFTVEVLRTKVEVFDFQVTQGDIQGFLNRKSLNHPELDNSSERTIKKAVQVMLRILEEAGVIDSAKSLKILPQLVNREVAAAIAEENPEWLKIYLFSDADIKNLTNNL
jgi:hypothetical protein